MSSTSDVLHNVKSTMVDYHHDSAGARQKVQIAGTYTDLREAKEAAKSALYSLGYDRNFFEEYHVQDTDFSWPHSGNVLVYARAPTGEDFTVEIETVSNTLKQPWKTADRGSRVNQVLFYVLQSRIDYELEHAGVERISSIYGIYYSAEDADRAARNALLEENLSKEDFAEYEEFTNQPDWAFGDDVMVHAVGKNGVRFLVTVVKAG